MPHGPPRCSALRLRFGLVPERAHRAVTTALAAAVPGPGRLGGARGLVVARRLARPPTVGASLDAGRQVLYQPQLLLLISALTIVSAAFHEIGHAAAAATAGPPRAHGRRRVPGLAGLLHRRHRLLPPRPARRLRTDLGGVYFNVLFVLATAGAYLADRLRSRCCCCAARPALETAPPVPALRPARRLLRRRATSSACPTCSPTCDPSS